MQIMEHLQKSYNFTWELRRPLDGGWGHMYKNGSWSGKIGMVVNNEVDFAMKTRVVTPVLREIPLESVDVVN